ncbi:MAG: UDP-N-acetylmuramate--alanine ligase, partial [Parcubacteria group bacterium Gr01-1014_2]
MMNEFNNVKSVHFIGIGGIGISSIARMMLLEKKEVNGSDTNESEITKELENLGAKIKIGHKKENLDSETELVIYTIAVPENNPELVKAKKLKIKILTYPEALGLISKKFYTIAISGTHGKTTTTAMTAKIFMDAGLKPTAIVGSLLKDERSNFVAGSGKFFIVEACEYKRSFLNLEPKILAITNIDNDHLDYYKNLKDIQKAFAELAGKIPKDGFLICNPNDQKIKPVLKSAKCRIIDYTKESDDFRLKFP